MNNDKKLDEKLDKKKKNVIFNIPLILDYDEIILNDNLIRSIINKSDHVYVNVAKRPQSYINSFPAIKGFLNKRYIITDLETDNCHYNAYYIKKKLTPILLENPLIINYFKADDYAYHGRTVCFENKSIITGAFKKWFKYTYGTNIGLSYVIVFNRLWYEKRYEILSDVMLGITALVCEFSSEDFETTIKLFKSTWQYLDFNIHDAKIKQEDCSFVFDAFEGYYNQIEERKQEKE